MGPDYHRSTCYQYGLETAGTPPRSRGKEYLLMHWDNGGLKNLFSNCFSWQRRLKNIKKCEIGACHSLVILA